MINLGLLILATTLNVRAKNTTANETEQNIKSLDEVEKLEIVGELITIVKKNDTHTIVVGDAFDEYLQNHIIRIKSPLEENKCLDFELDRLIPEERTEGRQKKRKGPIRELLIPLLLAIKHKLSFALPLFLAALTFVAFKAFWAGMTGLVISKIIGLKLLLQPPHKNEDDKYADQDNNQEENEEGYEENEKPVVVYLQSRGPDHKRRFSVRRHLPAGRDITLLKLGAAGKTTDFKRTNWDNYLLKWDRDLWNQSK